jgi:GNAT superfamily N-acetyltransferase
MEKNYHLNINSQYSGITQIELISNDFEKIGEIGIEDNIIMILFIKKKFRRNGYGSLMLKKAESLIRNNGFKQSCLYFESLDPNLISNTEVKNFYLKNGYTTVPWYKKWYYGHNECYLCKNFN